MKFKCDENLPEETAGFIRAQGHDAHSVLDENLDGSADPLIAEVCRKEGRILLTLDLDFANIRRYPPQEYPGIIVLRPARQDRDTVLAIVARVLALLENEDIAGRLWIVDGNRTRIRGGD